MKRWNKNDTKGETEKYVKNIGEIIQFTLEVEQCSDQETPFAIILRVMLAGCPGAAFLEIEKFSDQASAVAQMDEMAGGDTRELELSLLRYRAKHQLSEKDKAILNKVGETIKSEYQMGLCGKM